MRAGDRAWIALGVGVVAWEIWGSELLSTAADRYMLHHPWLTRTVAFTLAAHCCNVIPDRYDPIHQGFAWKQRVSSNGDSARSAHLGQDWRRHLYRYRDCCPSPIC